MPRKPVKLYSTAQVAEELGISVQRVKQLASDRGVGQLVGKTLVFQDPDIDALRYRRPGPGRPAQRVSAPKDSQDD